MLDILIKNGTIVDGTGTPSYCADLGICDEKIVKIGKLNDLQAKKVIDASGLIITPGFIDIHSHTDTSLLLDSRAISKLKQGVTTELSGNCGYTPFPVNDRCAYLERKWLERHNCTWDWHHIDEFLTRLEKKGIAINYATLVGHGSIRQYVMGDEMRDPTDTELNLMSKEVARAMEAGAFGLSTGLIYPPGCYAKTKEIIALAKVASKYNGIYTTHLRSEGKFLIEAIEEAINISKKANILVQISHLKVAGRKNWGKASCAIEVIERAQKENVSVFADRYPYSASSSGLDSLLPSWTQAGGVSKLLERLKDQKTRKEIKKEMEANIGEESGWEDTLIVNSGNQKHRDYIGKCLAEIARERQQEIADTVFDLLLEAEGEVSAIFFSMDEKETELILAQSWISIGSDSAARAPDGPLSEGKPHPRSYGTFPRVISYYCRERKIFSLEEAVKKMTWANAQRMGLSDRGKVAENYIADLVIFDLEKIKDNATYTEPHQFPSGIEYVIVNGKIVVDKGNYTGILAGKVLRHK